MPSRFEVDDGLWAELEPLLPVVQRRYRYPGRKRLDDRAALNGIRGVSYKNVLENGKHIITASFTGVGGSELKAHFEQGTCVLLGTEQTATILGSLTIKAFDEGGKQVHVIAKGKEDK